MYLAPLKHLNAKKIMSAIALVLFSVLFSFVGGMLISRAAFLTDCSDTATTGISESECIALGTFYDATNGDDWTINTGWGTNTAVSSWYGVTVTDSSVTALYLPENNLTGFLPSGISGLTSLKSLNLSDNQITGALPNSLGTLLGLELLDLSNNLFFGYIPESLANLSNLTSLDLSNNNFTGGISDALATFLTGLANQNLNGNNLDSTLFFTNCSDTTITGIPQSECEALEDFYRTTNGPDWGNHLYWGTNKPVISWAGIDLTYDSVNKIYHVNRIILEDNNLVGYLPDSIEDLTQLEILDLRQNKLTESIPNSIGNISTLKQLDLRENQISGELPSELGNLVNLEYLELAKNRITGSIPGSFGGMTSLIKLNLGANLLTGSIPSTLGSLSNLEKFYLNNNQLTGSIPTSIGNLSNLEIIYFSYNQLSGPIPTEIGNLTKLKRLQINSNQLTGSIPTTIGNLTLLTYLTVANNNLTGTIPTEIGNLVLLDTLNLQNNQLEGPLPDTLSNLVNLVSLYLNNNIISGAIPDLTGIPHLKNLTIQNNRFIFEDFEDEYIIYKDYTNFGYVPQATVDIERTETFKRGDTLTLTPSVPINPSGNDMYQWYKDGEKIEGATDRIYTKKAEYADAGVYTYKITNKVVKILELVSEEITVVVESVCSDTATTGIPESECQALIDLYDSTNGEFWGNNTNWLTSTAANTWFGVTVSGGTVTKLELPNNSLTGKILPSLKDLPNLTILNLSNNAIKEEIPKELGSLSNLETLNLSKNQFSGSIPELFGGLSSLKTLNLSQNKISGNLPTTLSGLTNLVTLDLSKNSISGTIPTVFGGMTNLQTLNLSFNKLNRGIPSTLGSMTGLIILDLSNNNLSGHIPTTIGALNNLFVMNLSYNSLNGLIPSSLTTLTNISELYLNNNNLSGNIPDLRSTGFLDDFEIQENKFLFMDFEDEYGGYSGFSNFKYYQQQKVDETRFLEYEIGTSVTLEQTIPINPSGNDTYQWFKDGIAIPGATSLNYTKIFEEEDAGVYHYEIKNTVVPTLVLISNPITIYPQGTSLEVDCSKTEITRVPESECLALKDLYALTDGDHWEKNTLWKQSTNIDSWFGITVFEGHVTKVELPHNKLEGLLPTSLQDLTKLEVLSLDNNNLFGEIPVVIGSISPLIHLDLSSNQISGGIPDSLGNLTNLEFLSLSQNNLTGSIPDSIGNLIKLKTLNLDQNQLSCSIPSSFEQLVSLTFHLGLQLFSNNLELPPDTPNPDPSRTFLSTLYNFLDQKSAVEASYFTNQNASFCATVNRPPTDITLSSQSIEEELADVSTVGIFSAVDPDSTTFTYTLIDGFGDDDNLSFQIVGDKLQTVSSLDFETQSVYKIRVNVSDGTNNYAEYFTIKVIDVHDQEFVNCALQDYIPIKECEALIDFYNALDGDNSNLNWKSEPDITKWNNIKTDYFEGLRYDTDRDLSGLYDPDPLDPCNPDPTAASCLDFDLDGVADFTTDVNDDPVINDPDINDPCNPDNSSPRCLDFDLDGILNGVDDLATDPCSPNAESAECKKYTFMTLRSRHVVSLSGKRLSGFIPDTIANLEFLKSLRLDNNNNITGLIPKVLGDMKLLEHLLLANNDFRGTIPIELANLPNLKTLTLSRNKLVGKLPPELGNLTNLRYLYLFDNKFVCTIPESYMNLKKLIEKDGLRIHDNKLLVPDEDSILYKFLDRYSPTGLAHFTVQPGGYCGEVPTDISLSNNSIDENMPIETLIGVFSTADLDDTNFTYTFVEGEGDDDNEHFKIVGNQLLSGEPFDFETQNKYTIRINTNDGFNDFEKSFTININDINLPPANIFLDNNIIEENQILKTLVGRFTMEDDQESDGETYTLVSGVGSTDNEAFYIDGNELRTNKVFDFTVQSAYFIRVNVNDGVNDFSKAFVITIKGDRDGDGEDDGTDPDPDDPCIPNPKSLACLNLDRDNDGVVDGADLDPNDPCIPDSGSTACKVRWGPFWNMLYGDGTPFPGYTTTPEPEPSFCGWSCIFSTERYEGGYFTGATGPNGSFRIGDYITYIAPKGHPLEQYYINYGKIGHFKTVKAGESVQVKRGYLDEAEVRFPIYVKNRMGRRVISLSSPKVKIDNKVKVYKDKGYFLGGKNGIYQEGDRLKYIGPSDRNNGDRFQVDLHEIGLSRFLKEYELYELREIKSFYGKYIEIFVTATDKSGNKTTFKGPEIWFGIKGKKPEPFKTSAPKPKKQNPVSQWKKSAFIQPPKISEPLLFQRLAKKKKIERKKQVQTVKSAGLLQNLKRNVIGTPKQKPSVNPFFKFTHK